MINFESKLRFFFVVTNWWIFF